MMDVTEGMTMSMLRAHLTNGLVIDCPLHGTAFDGEVERAVTRSCDGNALVETAADGWSRRVEFTRGDGWSTLEIKLSKPGETFCVNEFSVREIAPAERTTGPNLVTNGDFSDGASGWQARG